MTGTLAQGQGKRLEANPEPAMLERIVLRLFVTFFVLLQMTAAHSVVTNPAGTKTIVQPANKNLNVNRLEQVRYCDQFAGADAAAKIAACIADVERIGGGIADARALTGIQTGASGFSLGNGSIPVVLLLGQVTLTLSGGITVNSNSAIHCMSQGSAIQAGAKLTTQVVTLTGTNPQVKYCKVDGGAYALNAIYAGDNVANFLIKENECTNTSPAANADCISVISVSGTSTGKILGNFVHDWGARGGGIAVRGAIDTEVAGNVLYGNGGSAAGYAGIQLGGTMRANIHHNHVKSNSNWGTSCFRDIAPIFDSNQVAGNYNRGMECDNAYAPVWNGNTIRGPATSGYAAIEAEVSPSARITGNTVDSAYEIGVHLFGRFGVDQVLLNDAETNWTCSANVACSLDGTDKKAGASSVKMAVGSGFTSGAIAYGAATAARDVNGYLQIRMWLKSDTRIMPGTLAVRLSTTTGFSDNVVQEPLPGLYANQWTQLYVPMRVYWNKAGMTSINSVGLVTLSAIGPLTLHVDDVQVENLTTHSLVSGNVLTNVGVCYVNLDQTVNDSDIAYNTMLDAGVWGVSASGVTGICNQTSGGNAGTGNRFIGNSIRTPLAGSALGNLIGIDERGSGTYIAYNTIVGFPAGQDIYNAGTNTVLVGNRTADTDATFRAPTDILFTATTFATLGAPANGTIKYCSNCKIANPCAGGGTGAIAKRLNGVWVCN